MSSKWSCSSSSCNWVHHWSFNFCKSFFLKIFSEKSYNLESFFHSFHNFPVHYKVNISLSISCFNICQPMEFFRKRSYIFRLHFKRTCPQCQFSCLSSEQYTFYSYKISYSQFFIDFILFFPNFILLYIILQFPCRILNMSKSIFSHSSVCNYSSCRFKYFTACFIIFVNFFNIIYFFVFSSVRFYSCFSQFFNFFKFFTYNFTFICLITHYFSFPASIFYFLVKGIISRLILFTVSFLSIISYSIIIFPLFNNIFFVKISYFALNSLVI